MKKCTVCKKNKILHMDFYMCQGKYRSACKVCMIKKNGLYQKRHRSWESRTVDLEYQRKYSLEYYAKNKEKFAKYRKTFKEKFPAYHREYARNKKNNKLTE